MFYWHGMHVQKVANVHSRWNLTLFLKATGQFLYVFCSLVSLFSAQFCSFVADKVVFLNFVAILFPSTDLSLAHWTSPDTQEVQILLSSADSKSQQTLENFLLLLTRPLQTKCLHSRLCKQNFWHFKGLFTFLRNSNTLLDCILQAILHMAGRGQIAWAEMWFC